MTSYKTELDKRVAARLGLNRRDVSEITFEFIEVVRHVLVEEGVVLIPRLGRLTAKTTKRRTTFQATDGSYKKGVRGKKRAVEVNGDRKVYFAKSLHLKDELEKHHGEVRR